jgi:hypothetical protein
LFVYLFCFARGFCFCFWILFFLACIFLLCANQPPHARVLLADGRFVGVYRFVHGHNADRADMEDAVAQTAANFGEVVANRKAMSREERPRRGEVRARLMQCSVSDATTITITTLPTSLLALLLPPPPFSPL